jgi:hypothetical protein
MHAALMHCSGMADAILSEQAETEQLEGDQARLARFERGVFEVADRDLNKVPRCQNDAFMQQLQQLAAFDHVRAAPPPAGSTTCGRDLTLGEHPNVSKQHNVGGQDKS